MMRIMTNKQKKGTGAHGDKGGGNMILISVTVQGSTGPIRSIVKEEQLVSAVIRSTLKSYAREGRFPALGSDQDQFLLYCSNRGSDALVPEEMIGKSGARDFIICKKPKADTPATDPRSITRKGWLKEWLRNSLSSRAALSICERRVGREG
ncbi:hypothetical protein MLD38_011353 [Melastoma candidum]|uniref:Uncharacterized protein n=1 Tax=Melastoma candidum TaxID=119954 RepID=A0ACB9R2T0_9MYRT|nr:hypothetical protein MLD38_011353 [Melastoma candidum]